MPKERTNSWFFITPTPDVLTFDPALLAALAGPGAPPHIRVRIPGYYGFAVEGKAYEDWLKKDGPIEVVSPRHVMMYSLSQGCGSTISQLMAELTAELTAVSGR